MNVLEVEGLCKAYPGFHLQSVSFSVAPGSIMGFIGRNGAGKTTTLKSLLHLVHPDAGAIRFFGLDLEAHEGEIKQRIGYAGGAVDFYRRKPIRALAEVTRSFYPNWDEAAYRRYMDAFSLDEGKTPAQLSEGMRVKLSLALAMSHRAELLILDEPTSGLDPVSREELLDAFTFLRSRGVAILFSTHITSDLEKCADHISYISGGRLLASEGMQAFLARCAREGMGETLEEIMVHCEKESLYDKLAE
ncbi:MAG: ABC transporter ATP-binding protein [Ruminococcaceae bacterium]|nr:ABC transporter ATP-binding protein [Oscillospiraceae bacterium]